jgi:hypothetical protein
MKQTYSAYRTLSDSFVELLRTVVIVDVLYDKSKTAWRNPVKADKKSWQANGSRNSSVQLFN